MKKTTKIDELNILEYFSEMELPQEEIDKRVALAEQIKQAYHEVFVLVKAQQQTEDDIDDELFENYLLDKYADIFKENNIDFTNEYIKDHVDETVAEVLRVTMENVGTAYYTSDGRAAIIAVNDSNAIYNYLYEQSFVKQGYKYKTWETMNDDRVRHSHIMADGQKVPITGMFDVGAYKMRFPCDTQYGGAEECVNCRCSASYTKN